MHIFHWVAHLACTRILALPVISPPCASVTSSREWGQGHSLHKVISRTTWKCSSCLTLCDSLHCSPPGSSIHGTLQARIPEWVATPFFRGYSQPRDQTQVSRIAGKFFTIWAPRTMWDKPYKAFTSLPNTQPALKYQLSQSLKLLRSHWLKLLCCHWKGYKWTPPNYAWIERSSPSQTHWFQYVDFVTSILTAQRSFLVLLTSWISAVFQGDRWGLKTTAKVVLLF